MRALNMIHVSFFFQLVGVHSHVLGVSFVCFERPLAITDYFNPIFKCIFPCHVRILVSSIRLSRWLWCLCSIKLISVPARRLLLELPVHILPAVPVLLSAGRQRLTAINFHNMTSDLGSML